MNSKTVLSPSSSNMPTYLRVTEDDIADLKKYKIGKKCSLELEVELISMSKGNEYEDVKNPKMSATFKVLSIETEDDKEVEPKPNALAKAMSKRV